MKKKKKKYQLWKMGTDIYSSVFYYLFYFFADSVGRYRQIQFL